MTGESKKSKESNPIKGDSLENTTLVELNAEGYRVLSKKCACCGVLHSSESTLKYKGSNRVGRWYNCSCGSTLLVLFNK